jgi:hypothetical protein
LKVAPNRWNTEETHERDAWKRVSEMVDFQYTAQRIRLQQRFETILRAQLIYRAAPENSLILLQGLL